MSRQPKIWYSIRSCQVIGCSTNTFNTTFNNNDPTSTRNFFAIPTDKKRRIKWLKNIHREELLDSDKAELYVCDRHFEHITLSEKLRNLPHSAYPQGNIPSICNADTTEKNIKKKIEDGDSSVCEIKRNKKTDNNAVCVIKKEIKDEEKDGGFYEVEVPLIQHIPRDVSLSMPKPDAKPTRYDFDDDDDNDDVDNLPLTGLHQMIKKEFEERNHIKIDSKCVFTRDVSTNTRTITPHDDTVPKPKDEMKYFFELCNKYLDAELVLKCRVNALKRKAIRRKIRKEKEKLRIEALCTFLTSQPN